MQNGEHGPLLGISSCLLGKPVRYDGGHKLDHYLADTLGRHVRWLPVCPEVECGLSVPRESMRLVGDPASPRLLGMRTGTDYTAQVERWGRRRCDELARERLCGFVFKTRSPSSGLRGIKVYDENGSPSRRGQGIFARAFCERFPGIPVEDEGRLNDPGLRENFIERVFVSWRWNRLEDEGGSRDALVRFHTDHKLLVMAHSPAAVSALGRIVATAKGRPTARVLADYRAALMEALALEATARKNVNVLQHIAGYFKKVLSADEKAEVGEVIEEYRQGLVPIVVPIVLLRHHARRVQEPYLARQLYLNPYPAELMLRNHV
jgi:uncharacterized protein YbgA (DUF1722 family)/uncharacterized protein YbbK (DUF523 family)